MIASSSSSLLFTRPPHPHIFIFRSSIASTYSSNSPTTVSTLLGTAPFISTLLGTAPFISTPLGTAPFISTPLGTAPFTAPWAAKTSDWSVCAAREATSLRWSRSWNWGTSRHLMMIKHHCTHWRQVACTARPPAPPRTAGAPRRATRTTASRTPQETAASLRWRSRAAATRGGVGVLPQALLGMRRALNLHAERAEPRRLELLLDGQRGLVMRRRGNGTMRA